MRDGVWGSIGHEQDTDDMGLTRAPRLALVLFKHAAAVTCAKKSTARWSVGGVPRPCGAVAQCNPPGESAGSQVSSCGRRGRVYPPPLPENCGTASPHPWLLPATE
eukprot:scaffold2927_cov408-Prasinococcus_capsulatus_cf.AAC.21